MEENEVTIPLSNGISLKGNLTIPPEANAFVIFSHGSGSSRFSRRNNYVAAFLNAKKIATLLIDLLTEEEDEIYTNRFDIDLLTERLVDITNLMIQRPGLKNLKTGFFGASTGAASALKASVQTGSIIKAVVSRGGRPDLAQMSLTKVEAPTLLIVGSLDEAVIELNEKALTLLQCKKQLEIVEGASHLFEESGKLDKVARLAANWFIKHLAPGSGES